ncbi:pseudouridine synthase [Persicobacter psychrovividus]|uniref:Pseudouridine synthase n=1 Tax=Persicobacter psychrovividus TaxID=387638 RepID=A0ABM7VD51_9BACT|nr:pseudouridine synthase [Persicobacter psychrovividus]
MRLDKFICKCTDLTITEVSLIIAEGKIQVNGEKITEPHHQVHASNQVVFDQKVLTPRPFRYYMIHKPADTICSNKDEHYPAVFSLTNIPDTDQLHLVGRLDADTTGLLIATDDGHWSFNIMQPAGKVPKTYQVQLHRPITKEAIEQLEKGVMLQGEKQPTAPAQIEMINEKQVLLTITEGKFHQVKRMFFAVKNKVTALHRCKIGGLSLDIPEGAWREINKKEVEQ